MKKDNRIELYRFVAVLIIMIFHAGAFNSEQNHPIPLGHVFVEYFFFLTGYFTYRNVKNNIEKINISEYSFYYTFRKFKRFVPYVLMTVCMYITVMFVGDRFIKNLAITDTIKKLTGIPFDVLLLQITGICQTPRFDHWWYLSALLFSLPIAVMLFYKNICSGGVYRYVIYFTPLLIYGSFSQSVGGLDWNREIFGLLKVGIFRCFAGLFMGAVIYYIKGIITCREICVFKRVIMTVIELLSYTLSILIAWIWSDVANAEFLIVLLLVIALTITLSNSSYTVILDRQIFSYLGMMSLPIYICHYSIGYLIGRYWYNLDNYVKYLMYFVIVFLFSIIMLLTDMKVLRGVKGEPHR